MVIELILITAIISIALKHKTVLGLSKKTIVDHTKLITAENAECDIFSRLN